MYSIYYLCSTLDGVIRYIGITKNSLRKRLTDHISEARSFKEGRLNRKASHKYRWVNLHKENLTINLLCEEECPEQASLKETLYITFFKECGFPLVNTMHGPFLYNGRYKLTPEALQSKREARSKPEVRQAISARLMGHEVTPETREKIASKLRGKTFKQSPETIEKKRLAQTGVPRKNRHGIPKDYSIHQYTLSGQFVKTWDMVTTAAKNLGVSHSNIHACLKGRRPQAGGFFWKPASQSLIPTQPLTSQVHDYPSQSRSGY